MTSTVYTNIDIMSYNHAMCVLWDKYEIINDLQLWKAYQKYTQNFLQN